jgi:hypothetical protein
MVGRAEQRGRALLQGVRRPARLKEQRAQVQAQRQIVWRRSNRQLQPFEELRVDHDHDSMANQAHWA